MIKKKIKAAVIGLGVGTHHARVLSANPDCQLIWICDLNKNKIDDVKAEFPSAKKTQNDQDVLTDPNVDLVCIASYDQAHYRQVMQALKNNKHVFVEKPICLSMKEAKSIKNTLNKKPRLKISSNMVLRTCPLFVKVRDKVRKKIIKGIYHLEADYLWGRKEKLISGWRADADFYSIIHGAAVHMIDLAIWIVGKKPITVQAIGNNITTAGSKQKYNDFANILLSFDNKISVKVSCHGGCIHPHFHSLKVFGKNLTFLHESTGTVWVDSSNPKKKFIKEISAYPAKQERSKILKSFLNYLLNKEKNVLVEDKDVFDILSICIAAELSAKNGQKTNIEYL